MDELHSLIHSLTSSEWQALQVFLTAFTPRDPERLKYLKLAKMLMQADEPPTSEACCLKIYGKEKEAKFKMLKSRLKDKILDLILTDISADKQKELDELDYMAIKIKKKSTQLHQLFFSKKRMPLLLHLLEEIITISKQYEYYAFTVEHLRLKK